MFPPRCTRSPARSRIAATSAVVVVFPLVPVMPQMRAAASLEDEVHLAAHGDAVGAGDLELGRVPRHARARAHHERGGGDVVGVATEPHLDAARERRDALPDRRACRSDPRGRRGGLRAPACSRRRDRSVPRRSPPRAARSRHRARDVGEEHGDGGADRGDAREGDDEALLAEPELLEVMMDRARAQHASCRTCGSR